MAGQNRNGKKPPKTRNKSAPKTAAKKTEEKPQVNTCNEYDIVLPLYYNDGSAIELVKYQDLAKELIADFGGVTFFPQSNQGWRKQGKEYFQDKIVLFRVLGKNSTTDQQVLADLKKKLKKDFQQKEILIVRREVAVL